MNHLTSQQLAKDFRDLRVFQLAMDSAMEIFALTKKFPVEERYSLSDQIRRSSRSVCANIAEAWRKRRYPAAFVSKLSDADAEAAETSVWIEFAHRSQYIDEDRKGALLDKYDHICRQLSKMMTEPEAWILLPSTSRSTTRNL